MAKNLILGGAFKDLYIQTNLCNKFLKKLYKTMNFDLHINIT